MSNSSKRNVSSWLPGLLGPTDLLADGEVADVPKRGKWNLKGATITDNPEAEVTEISITPTDGPTITNTSTGTLNNVDSTNDEGVLAGTIRFTGVAPTVTGIDNGDDKRRLTLMAVGGPIVLKNENAGSTSLNRIVTGSGGDLTILQGAACPLAYDLTSLRWRVAGGGGSGLPPTSLIGASVVKHSGGEVRKKAITVGHFDPVDYGIDNTGVTDCTATLAALINTTASADSFDSGNISGVVVLEGEYYCASDLNITTTVHLKGVTAGRGQYTRARIRFARGKGLIIHGSAPNTIIENLDIYSDWVPLVSRVPSTAYALGDKIYSPGDRRFYFECTTAGTTSASTSPAFEALDPGTTNRTAWQVGHAFSGGEIDGSVVWTARMHAGISIKAPYVTIRNCSIGAFTNAGIYNCRSDTSDVIGINGNVCKILHNRIYYCGFGIALVGNDANITYTESNSMSQIGVGTINGSFTFGTVGEGCHGIQDHSFLGCTHVGNHVENQTGIGYDTYQGGSQQGAFLGNYVEAAPPRDARIYGGNIWSGGTAIPDLTLSTGVIFDRGNCWNIRFGDTTQGAGKTWGGGLQVAGSFMAHWMVHEDDGVDPISGVGWSYGVNGNASEYSLGFVNTTFQCVSILGLRATGGKDHWRNYRGNFLGLSGTDDIWIGSDYSRQVQSRYRRCGEASPGLQKIGDRFEIKSDGAIGSFTRLVVGVAGYRGDNLVNNPRWQANTAYAPYTDAYRTLSDQVEPSTSDPSNPAPGTPVFRCTVAGTSHASVEPTWSAHLDGVPFLDHVGGTLTWKYIGTVPTYYKSGKIEDGLVERTTLLAATWGPVAAPPVKSWQRTAQTTTSSANQVIDAGASFGNESMVLADNATTRVAALVVVKRASSATADVIEMKGSWVRNGAGPSALGSPTITADVGGVVTLHFAVNGNSIEIQSDPAAANTYNYTIIRTQTERRD